MTRPWHPPSCATAMQLTHQSEHARDALGKPIARPLPVFHLPRHANHHATARFCFRPANWLKRGN